MNRLIIFVSLALLVGACGPAINNEKGAVIAKVHNKYLYESDIKGLVPRETSLHDSIVMVKNFTDNWIKTRLMVEQAKKNLSEQQLDFDQQLDDYRNSLIIYRYETELIKQMLDTIVTDEEVEKYYDEHLGDFELKENIVKLQYVIVDQDSKEETLFKEIFKLPDSLILDSLEASGKLYARSYFLDTAYWFRFDDLLQAIPIETYNQELFLKGRRFIELSDDQFTYLLNFVDCKIKDDTSPL
ncbi:MAG: hypothetical protein KAR20_21720, partial [Candidatus Heimdallarchaeota archaeon]|nr:hypothetical protein [Candidatus Heimdallarchaeota archaeon]